MAGTAGLLLAGKAAGAAEVAGPITDIVFTQPQPAHPLMAEQATLGHVAPVGGIGPYQWSLVSRLDGKYDVEPVTGRVYGYWAALGATADAIEVVCVDGAGSRFQKRFPIRKTADPAPYLFFGGRRLVDANVNNTFLQLAWTIQAYGGDHNFRTDATTVSDPRFEMSYGAVRPAKNVMPPLGTYPLTVTSRSASGHLLSLDVVIQIVAFAPIARIQLMPGIVSTSQAAGVSLGRALATTPSNTPTWSLPGDAGGAVAINAKTGDVSIAKPLPAGPLTLVVKVVDRLATYSQSITIPVQQGTILPPENMRMAVSSALRNAGMGQAVGKPAVQGVTGKPRWSMTHNNLNLASEVQPYALPRRYAIDPATGTVTAPGLLSAQTDQLVITCTDGINTCTRSFDVPVAAAPKGPTFHVGRGMAASHGPLGFEHLKDVYYKFQTARPEGDWPTVLIYADDDPNYYANDIGGDYALRYGWHGPLTIRGVSKGGKQPRLGGSIDCAAGGSDMSGKAFFIFNQGDFVLENVEVSHVHGGGDPASSWPGHGLSGVRKDEKSYGNLTVRRCRIVSCDNGIHTGASPGNVVIEDCEIGGGGTAYVGSGATHNVYLGDGWRVEARRNIFHGATNGHDFKSRMAFGLLEDNRFYDGERGSASAQIDLPDGGEYVVRRNKFHKGANAQNGSSLQFCAEMLSDHAKNILLVEDNEFFVTTPSGNHFGPPCALRHYGRLSALGEQSQFVSKRNAFYLAPGATKFQEIHAPGHSQPIVENGSMLLTEPPALDFARPWGPGQVQRLGWLTFVADNSKTYDNFTLVQIDPGSDDIRLPVGSPAGTVLARCAAYGASWFTLSKTQPDPRINPFAAGVAWSLSQDKNYYGQVPWAPPGRYAVDARGVVTVTGPLVRGVDLLLVRAASPTGTLCDYRFHVSVV